MAQVYKNPLEQAQALQKTFFGRPMNSEEADDVLFALQAQYGNPKLTYEEAEAKYKPEDVEEAVDYILNKKGYNKFTYFGGDPYGEKGRE